MAKGLGGSESSLIWMEAAPSEMSGYYPQESTFLFQDNSMRVTSAQLVERPLYDDGQHIADLIIGEARGEVETRRIERLACNSKLLAAA